MNRGYRAHLSAANNMGGEDMPLCVRLWMHMASEKELTMKTIAKLAFAGALAAGAAVATAAPAEAAHVSFGIGIGAPVGYYGPRDYGPAYCDPYYYDCGYYGRSYYSPAYISVYGGHRWHHR